MAHPVRVRTSTGWQDLALVGPPGPQGPAGSGSALPADTVVVAATRIIANKLLAGDTQPAWRVLGSGKLEWGAGSTLAPDTDLFRSGGGQLKTSGQIVASGGLVSVTDVNASDSTSGQVILTGSAGIPRIWFGNTLDATLFRKASGVLGTTGSFYPDANASAVYQAQQIGVNYVLANKKNAADSQYAFIVSGDGQLAWGQGGATALDTNLYRSVAGTLQTDSRFYVNNSDFRIAGASAGITFNSDTNLYRLALNTLKTDGIFHAVGDVFAKSGTAGQVALTTYTGLPAVNFGGADSLYRSAVGVLKTDGVLQAGPRVQVRGDGTGGDILFGGSAATFDAAIYRSASRELAVDGVGGATAWLKVSADITARYSGSGGVGVMIGDIGSARSGMLLGASGDTNLYRSAANILKTDGRFYCGILGAPVVGGAVGGAQSYKLPLYNPANDSLIGYIPIYAT